MFSYRYQRLNIPTWELSYRLFIYRMSTIFTQPFDMNILKYTQYYMYIRPEQIEFFTYLLDPIFNYIYIDTFIRTIYRLPIKIRFT